MIRRLFIRPGARALGINLGRIASGAKAIAPYMLAALLCCFVQVCFAAGENSDTPTVTLHAPMTEWVTGPIPTRSNNGARYCSMKNAYQDGQTLVFARDNQGSNSIAVDFHKDFFDIGRQYPVKVHVGSVMRRVVALAATKQVMVMQTGVDSIFYNALRHKHNITFTVEKKDYGFGLDVSVADALSALAHCSDSFQNGPLFAETKFPLGKVSDAATAQQDDETASETDEEPAAPPKRHAHKSAKATKDQDSAKEVEDLQNKNKDLMQENEKLSKHNETAAKSATESAESPANAVRDEMKTEIASEILRLRASENHPTKASPNAGPPVVAAPVPPVAMAAITAPPRPLAGNTDLRNLLEASHVASGQQIKTGDNGNTLRWTSDDLYGSAQELPLASGKNLTAMASSYLRKTASLCKGEFAQKVGRMTRAGNLDVLEAEITCVDGQNDAAAAVLFVGGNGKFSVITQEGTIDQLTTAMSYRDSIVSAAANKASN